MFRISKGLDHVVDVDSLEQIEPAIRAGKPGRSHIDQIELDPLPSGHTSRRWGVGIKGADGSVQVQPDPWPDAAAP
jgi:hypothetical protein